MKRIFTLLTSAFLIATLGSAVQAQSAPPIGFWVTADGGEKLLVEANAQCSFAATGAATWGGGCTWQPSSRGGILSVWYSTIGGPAAVRWSVVWVNQTTITVDGDRFYRQQ
jgi:hypothetical protein